MVSGNVKFACKQRWVVITNIILVVGIILFVLVTVGGFVYVQERLNIQKEPTASFQLYNPETQKYLAFPTHAALEDYKTKNPNVKWDN